MPDDPISQVQAVLLENRVENHVERKYLASVHVIADLPT
jgi:hypothetical protein